MLHVGVRVPGRPPKNTMTEPVIEFKSSSHLYANKESCHVTKIFAYTTLLNGMYGDPREVTHLRTKAIGDKVHTMAVPVNDAACPWTAELPYVVTDWSNGHVRIDCQSDFGFWCQLPKNMLPAVHTTKRVELEHRAKRAKRAVPVKPVEPVERVEPVKRAEPVKPIKRAEPVKPVKRAERVKRALVKRVERVKRVIRAKPIKPGKR